MAPAEPTRKRPPAGPGGPAGTGGRAREIPDKLYFRIGEVARLCEVPAYVLRFWEGEFPQLKPNKGGTGQRLYRRRDVEMALRIKTLLYDEGYTIPGARQAFKSELRTSKEPQLGLEGVAGHARAGRANGYAAFAGAEERPARLARDAFEAGNTEGWRAIDSSGERSGCAAAFFAGGIPEAQSQTG